MPRRGMIHQSSIHIPDVRPSAPSTLSRAYLSARPGSHAHLNCPVTPMGAMLTSLQSVTFLRKATFATYKQ